MFTRALLLAVAASLTLLTGCRDEKIRTYRIPKEAPPPPMTAAAAAPTPKSLPDVHWEAPADWQEQPGNSMRIGSFVIKGSNDRQADFAITTFPGDVGGDFANVNRWRGQIQLPPIAENELSSAITSVDLPAGQFKMIEIVSDAPLADGKQKTRMLGAWLKQPERTWFFKMTGEDELVAAQREKFHAFLRSVHFSEDGHTHAPAGSTNSAPPAPASSTPPPASPSDMMSQPVPPPPPGGSLSRRPPSNWTPKPLGAMRKGSFTVRGSSGAEGDLSITMLGAQSNPLLENINRWRGQLALPPIDANQLETETTSLVNGDLRFTVLDYRAAPSGPAPGTRLLGAILYKGDEAWFFKLTGPDSVLAEQKDAFLAFLKTVKAD